MVSRVEIISVTPERARRIAVRAQMLDGSATGVLEVVRRLGFLQMDPISVVARPEHLVLYSRLGHVDVTELDRLLWEERKLFEWDAFIWPIEDLPLVRARMRLRRANATPQTREFLAAHQRLRQHLLRELDRNGPVLSRQFAADLISDGSHDRWWGRGQLRLLLDLLQLRGEIAVAGRQGRERLWDLADRVYPESAEIRWRHAAPLIQEQARRAAGVWHERGELRTYSDLPDDPVPPRLTFLSPFDQLIHDRARAEKVFDFSYRLEMYVPKTNRKYGYYVLPILRGDSIVGRVDLKRDKVARSLDVAGVWWENGTKPVQLGGALRRLEAAVCALP
jgi:uncharacterized protein YcaQ